MPHRRFPQFPVQVVLAFCLVLFFCPIYFLSPASAQTAAEAQNTDPDAIDNDTCFACHGDPDGEKYVDPEKFERSTHGRHLCTSCHSDITDAPHDVPLKPVSCGECHRIETEVYLNSDHGQALKGGNTEAAKCRSCHGEPHGLLNYRDPDSPVFRANIPKTCEGCHQNTQEMAKFNLHQTEPGTSYQASVHGLALAEKGMISAAVCTDCHGSHDLHRSTNPESKLYWKNIPATCGKCHENVREIYGRSVHGQAVQVGKRDAPVCTDCHGEHSIDAVKIVTSKVYPSRIPETCGQCHASERIVSKYNLMPHTVNTYMDSYHGLAAQLGSLTAANCASCHGFHDILPHTDPRSSIYPDNLPRTCGKCHAGVGQLVSSGQIHSGMRSGRENQFVSYVRQFYLFLILGVLSFMLLHNGLDFYKKLKKHYAQQSDFGQKQRMNFNERIQHAVLAISFILLAYTGFALKYPQTWWASPFMGRVDWRSLGHRVAALVFCVLALYHLYYIFFTAKGRKHLKLLLPDRTDLTHFAQTFQYYFGRRKEKPAYGFYGYIEKIEYWALVWGSSIMILTGALMLEEGWFLAHFPKWLFDVVIAIHFYEAILACSAILLWHGYFTMFDPDEYPMKWTWISGKESPADKKRERGPQDNERKNEP